MSDCYCMMCGINEVRNLYSSSSVMPHVSEELVQFLVRNLRPFQVHEVYSENIYLQKSCLQYSLGLGLMGSLTQKALNQ